MTFDKKQVLYEFRRKTKMLKTFDEKQWSPREGNLLTPRSGAGVITVGDELLIIGGNSKLSEMREMISEKCRYKDNQLECEYTYQMVSTLISREYLRTLLSICFYVQIHALLRARISQI